MHRLHFHGCVLGLWLAGGGLAAANPPAVNPPAAPTAVSPANAKATKAPPTKEVLQQYRSALLQGRAADDKGQLAEARRHFEAAVALLPEGGAAQSELGWVAYRLKDLPAAEKATRVAIAASSQPSLRAASLYNLGRILTDQGKKPEAVQAYKEAWELGRNPATLAALKELDPAAAEATWPGMHPLVGPVKPAGQTPEAQLLAACRIQVWAAVSREPEEERMISRDEIDAMSADRLHCEESAVSPAAGGVLEKAKAVRAGFRLNHYELSTIGVWVKTREGWFHDVVSSATGWKWRGETTRLKGIRMVGSLVEVQTESVQRDETQVASYYKGRGAEMGAPLPETIHETDRFLYVIGVGASGRPSVTSPIHVGALREVERDYEEKNKRIAEQACAVTLTPSGELQIGAAKVTRKKMSEKEFSGNAVKTPPGSFQLKFP